MEDLLQTIAEIAAAFAGFASIVVIFRRRDSVQFDSETRVTFQSMLLGSLFVIFFSLLPLVLNQTLPSAENVFVYSASLLLIYIIATFLWGIKTNPGVRVGLLAYGGAALTIAVTQAVGILQVYAIEKMYLVGVFTLLVISGYAFFSLITFQEVDTGDA